MAEGAAHQPARRPTCPLFNSAPQSSAFTTHLMDPAREEAYFAAWSPDYKLLFGYAWKSSDFPWMGIWEENRSRTHAPWNGQTLARGMEFGVSPMPETRRAMIDRGKAVRRSDLPMGSRQIGGRGGIPDRGPARRAGGGTLKLKLGLLGFDLGSVDPRYLLDIVGGLECTVLFAIRDDRLRILRRDPQGFDDLGRRRLVHVTFTSFGKFSVR